MRYTFFALLGEETKYYSVWKIAEAACILAGFGFEGVDEQGKIIGYRGVENVDILGFDFATCIAGKSRAWNKGTQAWLERYVYRRTNNSLFATYFVSAIWHGLYPGYFVFFLSIPLLTSVERLFRAKINPLVIPTFNPRDPSSMPKGIVPTLYTIFCWTGTTISLNYFGQPFSQFSFENSMRALGSYYFIPYFACFVMYGLLSAIPTPRGNKEKSDAREKKE